MGGKWKEKRPVKVSLEYDSEQDHFLTKTSVKILDGLAKLRAFCQVHFKTDGDNGGLQIPRLRSPSIGLFTDNYFVDYIVDQNDAMAGMTHRFTNGGFTYNHEIKAQRGHLLAKAWLPSNPNYSVDVAADFPAQKLFPFRSLRQRTVPKPHDDDDDEDAFWSSQSDVDIQTTFDFPYGRVFYAHSNREEEEDDEVRGFGAMVESKFGDWSKGRMEYLHSQKKVDLKYHYKDTDFTIAPTLSLPSKQCLLVFKRRFDEAHKLSVLYSLQEVAWEAVYKYEPKENLKLKAGHNSAANTLWTSLWVGREGEGASKAPKNVKGQVLLQFNHDTRDVALLFKFKKRFDLL